MPNIHYKPLTRLLTDILTAVSTPQDIANIVASSLVESSLRKVESHGILRISQYLNQVNEGWIIPSSRPSVVNQTPIMSIVDGKHGFGIYSLDCAIDISIENAKKNKFSIVGLTGSSHTGRIGWFAEKAATQDVITIIFGGGAHGSPDHMSVAPHAGIERVMATNPITMGFPVANYAPIIVDISTSMTSEGKIRSYKELGQKLPFEWILDKFGQPSRKADDFYDGGAILPFAGHKGYGLGIAAEFLTGILLGGAHELNWLVLALDSAAFVGRDQYDQESAKFVKNLKESSVAKGFTEIMVPGEPEEHASTQYKSQGIPLTDSSWQTITKISHEAGIFDLDKYLIFNEDFDP